MRYSHVILEGKPTTGKTEVSNLLKIFFPSQIVVLPELTTVLVREHRLNILKHRNRLTDLLAEAVPRRSLEVAEILASRGDVTVFEESHMGVHWAYSKVLDDTYFLDHYDRVISKRLPEPDLFMRLDMPVELSVKRQVARATKDVEVSGQLISDMFENLNAWHAAQGHKNLLVVDTNRAPNLVIADIMQLLDLEYRGLEP